jgi:hypothetical protein
MATKQQHVLVRVPIDGRRIAKRYAATAGVSMADWLLEAIVFLSQVQEKKARDAQQSASRPNNEIDG